MMKMVVMMLMLSRRQLFVWRVSTTQQFRPLSSQSLLWTFGTCKYFGRLK
jgi:hypothetical protein